MSRLLPQHFKRDGRPKKPLTEAQAQRAALRAHKNAYRCKFCRAWHIGGRNG